MAGDYAGAYDAVAIVSEGLERAKADPEVKNVVLDISNNGGGSLDVIEYIVSVVCGRGYHQWQNTLTGQWEKEHFDVDRNLDGVFDEKERALRREGGPRGGVRFARKGHPICKRLDVHPLGRASRSLRET